MENRDRDKVSRSTESTEPGDINRETSWRAGKQKSGSSVDFGENIGSSENANEPSRRSGSVGDSGMEGSSSSESSSSSSSSNLGENLSERQSGSSEGEH